MLTDVSMESVDAIPMAESSPPRRLNYWSDESEIIDLGLPRRLDFWSVESETNDLGLNDEEVEPGMHDEDELMSAVRLSSPFRPTGSSSPLPVATDWPSFSTPIQEDCTMSTDSNVEQDLDHFCEPEEAEESEWDAEDVSLPLPSPPRFDPHDFVPATDFLSTPSPPHRFQGCVAITTRVAPQQDTRGSQTDPEAGRRAFRSL